MVQDKGSTSDNVRGIQDKASSYEKYFNAISDNLMGKGREAIEVIYGTTRRSDLRGKWAGYHLLEYATSVRDKLLKYENQKTNISLDKSLKKRGLSQGFKEIQDLASRATISVSLSRNVFHALAEAQGTSHAQCLAEFVEFCHERGYPLIAFDQRVKSKNFDRNNPQYHELDLPKVSAELWSLINSKANAQSSLPIKKPSYFSKDFEHEDGVSLSPLDHYSIPLFGREHELSSLNSFLEKGDLFSILPVIGSAGAGKTRLVSQWLHQFVDSTEWAYGFVEDGSMESWQSWPPERNTVIVVDYIYRFDATIDFIIEKAKTLSGCKVRLVVIDRVFPEKLDRIRDDHISAQAFASSRKKLDENLGYFHDTLFLGKSASRNEILERVIGHVSGLSGQEVHVATQTLLSMGEPASHPLFAVLVGQILKRGLPIDSNWKRRDLVDYYLDTENRLPWRHDVKSSSGQNLGLYIGVLVVAATIKKGLSYSQLVGSLPDDVELTGDDLGRIVSYCSKIVSSNIGWKLKSFEPDILGENFFILLMAHISHHKSALEMLFGILSDESGIENTTSTAAKEEYQKAEIDKIVEFTNRVADNLFHDEPGEVRTNQGWQALASFFEVARARGSTSVRFAASVSKVETLKMVKDDRPEVFALLHHSSLDSNVLIEERREPLLVNAANSVVRYFELLMWLGDRKFVELFESSVTLLALLRSKNGSTPLTIASQQGAHLFAMFLLRQRILFGGEEEIDAAYFLSCQNNHAEIAKMLHFFGNVNADREDGNGLTALTWACLRGHIEIVKLLIESHGANADPSNDNTRTALIFACLFGQVPVIEYLLGSCRMDVNSRNESGWTPLLMSCKSGQLEVFRLVLGKYGADISLSKIDGTTAFMLACGGGHTDVVELMLKLRPEVIDQRDSSNRTALMYACVGGQASVASLLIDAYPKCVNDRDSEGMTALLYCCGSGDVEIVRLVSGCPETDLSQTDVKGRNHLMWAIMKGSYVVVRYLLDNGGVEIEHCDNEGKTALVYTCIHDHVELLRLLIHSYGASLNNVIGDIKSTPLIMACHNNSINVVHGLLEDFDIDVNQPDGNGTTPLMIASIQGHKEVIGVLIDTNELNISKVDNSGCTALMYACVGGHVDICRLMVSKHQADVNHLDRSEKTPLASAIIHGHTELASILISELGALNAKAGQNGMAPLMWACFYNRVEIAKLLMTNFGSDVDELDNNMRTPLMYAALKGHAELVNMLVVEYEANVELKDSLGINAMQYAEQNGYKDIVTILGNNVGTD